MRFNFTTDILRAIGDTDRSAIEKAAEVNNTVHSTGSTNLWLQRLFSSCCSLPQHLWLQRLFSGCCSLPQHLWLWLFFCGSGCILCLKLWLWLLIHHAHYAHSRLYRQRDFQLSGFFVTLPLYSHSFSLFASLALDRVAEPPVQAARTMSMAMEMRAALSVMTLIDERDRTSSQAEADQQELRAEQNKHKVRSSQPSPV